MYSAQKYTTFFSLSLSLLTTLIRTSTTRGSLAIKSLLPTHTLLVKTACSCVPDGSRGAAYIYAHALRARISSVHFLIALSLSLSVRGKTPYSDARARGLPLITPGYEIMPSGFAAEKCRVKVSAPRTCLQGRFYAEERVFCRHMFEPFGYKLILFWV